MTMKTSTRQVDGVSVVDLSGRITLGEGSTLLRDTVRDLISKGHKQILLNLGDVKVHWLVATGRTPLIVVIALAFVLGMIVDRLVIRARRKRVR